MEVSRRLVLAVPAGAAMMGSAALAAEPSRGWEDDAFFGKAVIDKDEQRGAGPTRHRYVHGQFEGTETKFALGFPDPSVYGGRFMQFLQGGIGGNEHTGYARGSHELAFQQGAYYVESNQGHVGNDMTGLKGDIAILDWRASAQTARFARSLAIAMYGQAPHHGYVTGGSGGGMRSILCMENVPAIYDGGVPFMINRNGLTHYNWSVAVWASIMLQDSLPAIARATLENRPAASAVKTDAERNVLEVLHRTGYPRRAEDQLGPNPLWILGMQMALAADPRYFLTFWQEPGFEGKDGAAEIRALSLDFEAEVTAVLTGDELAAVAAMDPDSEITGAGMRAGFVGKRPAAIRIRGEAPPERLLGSSLTFTTGASKDRRMMCTGAVGGALTATLDPKGFTDVAVGDRIRVSNRNLLAFAYYHRHHVDPRYAGMAQFFKNGAPLYPQTKVGLENVKVPTGVFPGKMILLQHLLDREALPTSAEPYIQSVTKALGAKTDDRFRVWWTDNAQHGVPQDARTRYIDYRGACSQAVADVIAWVEKGTAPPPSTRYHFDDMTQVVVPSRAAERRGIQPVIAFTGPAKATVGRPVRLKARIEAPVGSVVKVDFDFDGSGRFASPHPVATPVAAYTAEATHVFEKPGRHVVTVRAQSERSGRANGYLVQNLARLVVTVV